MLRFLFFPAGRVSRADYWLRWLLPSTLAQLVIAGADEALGARYLTPIWVLVSFWPNMAITIKRYHDRGMSGWWVLWSILIVAGAGLLVFSGADTLHYGNIIGAWISAFVGLYVGVFSVITFALIVYFLPGERGANRFGPDPLLAKAPRKPRKDPAVEFPGPWTQPRGTGLPAKESPSHRRSRPTRRT